MSATDRTVEDRGWSNTRQRCGIPRTFRREQALATRTPLAWRRRGGSVTAIGTVRRGAAAHEPGGQIRRRQIRRRRGLAIVKGVGILIDRHRQ